ncbi:MAG: two-component system sensor histidine kinase CreC [Desulfobacteraceae bacterium]|nr:two-component system sensor histidine kinase CreC [Desulfobacteraceae bacterium]
MKLGLRIFFCSLVIFLLCFAYPISWVMNNARMRYLEGVEDPLADHANILAEIVGGQMAAGTFHIEELQSIFERVYARQLDSQIYSLNKQRVDLQVYLTDTKGTILFHSKHPDQTGQNYTHWRDVALALEGRYGARTSLDNPKDPTSSVLYVAAPVMVHGQMAGVLTVAKPTTNINHFLKAAKPKFLAVTATAAVAAVALSYLAALWIASPIRRLTAYADAIRAGQRPVFPKLDRTEIGGLGRALQRMQERLEGKAYVEQYVQKLTHEVKSPLSAIRGAAELLEEDMPAANKQRFLANIRAEADRIQVIVDCMLELASLEFKKQLPTRKPVNLQALSKTVLESKAPMLIAKKIAVATDIDSQMEVYGDPFLLHQALANLVQNAIDFCEREGVITLSARNEDHHILFKVEDNGASIPDYAIEKIFDKFYSLQRPDSGKKSTGLGLNLVREVAQLHQGTIHLENIAPQGVRATFILPR